jgi:WD40 repeat protein
VLSGLGATASPTGRLIALGARFPGPASLWTPDGRLESVLVPPQKPCGVYGYGTRATFSSDGSVVAVAAKRWRYGPQAGCSFKPRFGAAVWRIGSREPRLRIPSGASGRLGLDRTGALFVDGGRVWTTRGGARLRALDGTLALSQDGRRAVVSHGEVASVVSVPSGRPVAGLRDAGRVYSAVFSPDGRRVLTQQKGALDLWDATTGRLVAPLRRSAESVKAFSFAADGRLVEALFGDRAATFDAATGKPLASLGGKFSALSPDGSVAVSVQSGTVRVVDLKTGVATVLPTGSANPITAVQFGPVSSLLLAEDTKGGVVRVLRCAVCASDGELLRQARSTLGFVSRFDPRRPPVAVGVTG